jgi:acyl-CoA hydrolase
MPGLGGRFSTVVKAKISKMLDRAEDPRTGTIRHTTTAYLTMVALDDDGRPTEVPALQCESEEERRREREAQLRRANRLAEREQILAGRSPLVE